MTSDNTYAENLYKDLDALVKSNNAFYSKTHTLDGRKYRVFSYYKASYTDFTQNSALECRGIMFDITNESDESDESRVILKSLPMEKFFNLNENPFTMDLDLTKVTQIYEKADGSLISTYIHYGPTEDEEESVADPKDSLMLKSKTSITSEHCTEAMKWLNNINNKQLKEDLTVLARSGFTVNLEWCSPEQRIVIAYEKPMLKVLNIRSHKDGSYRPDLITDTLKKYMVESIAPEDPVSFIKSIPDLQDNIEGFVLYIKMHDGSERKVKVKTKLYFNKHELLGNVKNPRSIYNIILDDQIDDVRAQFHDDKVLIKMIDEMQVKVSSIYNTCVSVVEKFYEDNKSLCRRDFAIKGKSELEELHFSLVMLKYSGKAVNYAEILKNKWREFGIINSEELVM
jgi:T4 RnlA family RNA ligase